MNKRGQVFILSAIIIVFLLYSTIYTYNTLNVHGGLEDFEKNVQAYEKESTLVVNDAIYQGKTGEQQADALKEWASIFKEGVKSSDPNFGSISIYKDTDGNVHIINTLTNKSITIEYLSSDASAESTKLNFFSSIVPPKGDSSEGQICSKTELGEICTTVNTDLSNFGSGFDYSKSIEGVDLAYLCIKVQDINLAGSEAPCPDGTFKVELKGFQSVSTSSQKTEDVTSSDSASNNIIKVSYPK